MTKKSQGVCDLRSRQQEAATIGERSVLWQRLPQQKQNRERERRKT